MPKLRFKGFMDDWEQRKLGDVCCFINGDRSSNYPSTADFIDSGIPFVGSDALGETLVNKTKLRYISREKYQQMNGLKIEIDDVLYTLRGAGFGKCSIADFSNGTVASSCVGIRCTEELDAKFLVQWLSSPSADNEKNMAVNGSTAQNISVEDMKNYVICAPGLDEQKKVSAQLYTLDKLITLHQRKCDELQKVKKYMLQKMFPKKGEKVPEIRLAGFTGDWEQWKVGDIFRVTRGYVLPATETDENYSDEKPYPVYSSQTKENGLMGYYGEYLYENAITWTTDGANAGTVNYRSGKFYCTNVCGVLLSDEGYANKMVAEALNAVAWKYVSLVGNPKLMNNVMSEIEMNLPKSIEEQQKIGECLTNIDNIITLYQRKCDTLKETKKYMLQNMFPKN